MIKKFFTALAIGVFALLAVPSAAQAYTPTGPVIIGGDATPGGTIDITIPDGTFDGGEEVNVQVGNDDGVVASAVVNANEVGGVFVEITLPDNASGTYNVTATGVDSGAIATANFNVTPADSGSESGTGSDDDDDLAATGANGVPMLAIWTASGLALLGIALIAVMTIVRRQRAGA